jgi:hypothetical protein
MSFCSQCGNKIEVEAKFCSSCGNSIMQQPQEYIITKMTETQIDNLPNKKASVKDIKEYFSEGKNIYFGKNIPWGKFKEFIRIFNELEIDNLEYLVYCNNTGFGSGSSNGFAIAKNQDKLLLLVCSYETTQVLVKVVSQNYFSVFEICNENIFYLENSKLIVKQLDIIKNEINVLQFSIMREKQAFEELVAFTETIKKYEIEIISNGMKLSSDKLSNVRGISNSNKFLIFALIFALVAGLLGRACN